MKVGNPSDFNGVCPRTAPVRKFDVTAISAAALPGGKLIYNPRVGNFGGNPGPLNDPTALIYANSSDLDVAGALKPGVPVEPLVLRARAGDCIMLTLRNRLPATVPDQDGFSGLPPIVMNFNANQIRPSSNVGMQPQMLAYDVSRDDGMNIGRNNGDGTVPPGGSITYRWYAGDLARDPATDKLIATPVEFGTVNLLPADTIEQGLKGLGAVLVIEPPGATWTTDATTRTAATVTSPSGTFREFVVMTQGSVNLRDRNGKAICPIAGAGAEAGVTATLAKVPMTPRKAATGRSTTAANRCGSVSVSIPVRRWRRPAMSIRPTRCRTPRSAAIPPRPSSRRKRGRRCGSASASSAGHTRNGVFQVHGHVWQREPYVAGSVASQSIGNNPQSEYRGAQEGLGTGNHFDIVLQNGAGGAFKIPGDYLFRDQASFELDAGRWGLFRVQP